MLSIQPTGKLEKTNRILPSHNRCDKELRSVSIFSCISHRKKPRYSVLRNLESFQTNHFEFEILISEFLPIYGFSSPSIAILSSSVYYQNNFTCKISSLEHEIGDDSVKLASPSIMMKNNSGITCNEGVFPSFRFLSLQYREPWSFQPSLAQCCQIGPW